MRIKGFQTIKLYTKRLLMNETHNKVKYQEVKET